MQTSSNLSIYLTRGGYVNMLYGALRTAGSGHNGWLATAFRSAEDAYNLNVGSIIHTANGSSRWFGFTV